MWVDGGGGVSMYMSIRRTQSLEIEMSWEDTPWREVSFVGRKQKYWQNSAPTQNISFNLRSWWTPAHLPSSPYTSYKPVKYRGLALILQDIYKPVKYRGLALILQDLYKPVKYRGLSLILQDIYKPVKYRGLALILQDIYIYKPVKYRGLAQILQDICINLSNIEV